MNPIYAARIARVKAENVWRAVDRDVNASAQQRTEAREAYAQAKRNYRAAFKQDRAQG